MDYKNIHRDSSAGVFGQVRSKETVKLPFRELTEEEAQIALFSWTKGEKKGYKAIRLFGQRATESWTVAVMSDLKSMITNLKRGRLKWVLSTAMPLRDDFQLYLNGEKVESQKYEKPLTIIPLDQHNQVEDLDNETYYP